MTANNEALEPNEANDDRDSQDDAGQSRGAFDLRKGKIKREGQRSLYWMIAGLVLFIVTLIVGGWMWVVAEMRSGTQEIDESQIKADATLETPEPDDGSMQRIKAQKLQEIEEARRKAEAAKGQANQSIEEEKEGAGQGERQAAATAPNNIARTTSKDTPQTPWQRKLAGGVVVQAQVASGSAFNASSTAGAATRHDAAGMGAAGAGGFPPTALDLMGETEGEGSAALNPASGRASLGQLGGTGFAPSKAVLAPQGKYLLRHNTYTSCVLYTEIVTDYPGLIECRLTEPLYSADGSTVIAEAGDRLTGEQRTEVRPGQTRVFTSWTELETATGVRARLDSLGTGPMGASGTSAWIDNHYMQRFGGAVMLSMIQDALQIATNRSQKSNSDGYTVNNTESSVENMADKALENSINIPPTAYILPGTVMNVVVARDIDFSSVFENR
ncbi:TPA: TrbI/VirB10 family protein [Pseudomonas aeruginosa]|nr:TrbI/VirB10 family protein [Pseudomonas aeruginosa]HDQ4723240.1 TrbI/VirB10 family protein [Pseudomonas aeruginosa]